jgi:hypothetical protein
MTSEKSVIATGPWSWTRSALFIVIASIALWAIVAWAIPLMVG